MASRSRSGGLSPGSILAGHARALARAAGITLPDLRLLSDFGPPVAVDVQDGAGPASLGTLHESLLAAADRKGRGAFYTPTPVADRVARWAIEAAGLRAPVVCDPACGGGAFLLAAADVLAAGGASRVDIVRRLVAIDIDPLAVAVTEAALCLWAHGTAVPVTAVGDALLDDWPVVPDVVVGNPPFLGQLSSTTARSRPRATALVDALGPAARGYVDEAALFLLASYRRVAAGGAVGLLQPEPVLAAAAASGVREEVAVALDRVWLVGDVFEDAAVRVCAVVLRKNRAPKPVQVIADVERSVDVAGGRWGAIIASARGVPSVALHGPALGASCTVTAGFRDEYYGLQPFVRERDGAPLVTSGLIDPAHCRWGEAPARFGGVSWSAPAIDTEGLSASALGRWAATQLVPKVVVATQTRVVEAVADPAGEWLPCTPVITVVPRHLGLWHVLAVLLAPPVTAWALAEAGGSARSGDALKLSAAQARLIPLPPAGATWDQAADAVRLASSTGAPDERRSLLLAAGQSMCAAYGVDESVLAWWAARLPYREADA